LPEGWGIDHAARPLGWFVTKSQRLAGSDIRRPEQNQRLPAPTDPDADGKARTQVRVEREVFRRERVLWTDRDERRADRRRPRPIGPVEERVWPPSRGSSEPLALISSLRVTPGAVRTSVTVVSR